MSDLLPTWERELLDRHGGDAATVLRLRDRLRPQFADAGLAGQDLQAFLEADGRPALALRQLANDPKALDLLLQVGQVSRYAFDVVRQHPRAFWEITQERQYRHVWGRRVLDRFLAIELGLVSDPVAKGNALARFKHRQWLRILLGELSGELRFPQVVQQLSAVVDTVVAAALDLAIARLAPRFGTIVPPDHPLYPGFTVMGMG